MLPLSQHGATSEQCVTVSWAADSSGIVQHFALLVVSKSCDGHEGLMQNGQSRPAGE